MSGDQKKLEILIQTILDKTGATEATAEIDKLTVGQRNLATGIPDLTAKTEAFRITTEAEYLAIRKAYEAVTAKIPVLAAAGKSTTEFERAQTNLNETLSTENAILIAEQIETKAAAAAALEKAEADKMAAAAAAEATVANEAMAASNTLNAATARELVVVGRELARGNYSRLAGSVSILGQQFGLLKTLLSPVGIALAGVGVAAYFLYEHLKKVNEALDEISNQQATEALKIQEETVKRLHTAWDDAATALGDYLAKMAEAGQDNDPTGTEIKRIKELTAAEIDSKKKIVEALGEVTEARMRENGATPEQISAAKEQTALQLAALDEQREQANGSQGLQQEYKERQAAGPQLNKNAVNALATAAAADSRFGADQADLANARGLTNPNTPEGKALQKRINDANAGLTAAQNISDFTVTPDGGVMRADPVPKQQAIQQAQDKLAAANNELAQARRVEAQLEQSMATRLAAKKEADDTSDAAQAQSTINKKRLTELPGEISQAQAVEQAKGQGDRVAGAEKAAGSAVEAGEHLAELAKAGQTSGHQNDQLMTIASQIAGHAVNLQTAVQIMENGANNITIFMNQVGRLTSIFSQMNSGQIAQMKSHIDQVEAIAKRALANSNLH